MQYPVQYSYTSNNTLIMVFTCEILPSYLFTDHLFYIITLDYIVTHRYVQGYMSIQLRTYTRHSSEMIIIIINK